MIFVTVGTHEQQFDRLIKKIDELKRDGIIEDEVVMQIGYSTYEPQYCEWKKLLTYNEMNEMYEKADIIITHGGPASFMKALELKKIPIVVPRQVKYAEHINDHQVEFVEFVETRLKNIIALYDIDELSECITYYRSKVENLKNNGVKSNNKSFNNEVNDVLVSLYKGAKKQ